MASNFKSPDMCSEARHSSPPDYLEKPQEASTPRYCPHLWHQTEDRHWGRVTLQAVSS